MEILQKMNLKRLKTYPFPKSLLHVLQKLARHGFEAYVVGGAVRDILLDLVPHEYDVATCALPAQKQGSFVPTSKRGEVFGSIMIRTYEKTTSSQRIEKNLAIAIIDILTEFCSSRISTEIGSTRLYDQRFGL